MIKLVTDAACECQDSACHSVYVVGWAPTTIGALVGRAVGEPPA